MGGPPQSHTQVALFQLISHLWCEYSRCKLNSGHDTRSFLTGLRYCVVPCNISNIVADVGLQVNIRDVQPSPLASIQLKFFYLPAPV